MTRDEWRNLPPQAVIRLMGVTYYMKIPPDIGNRRALWKTLHQSPQYTIEFGINGVNRRKAVSLDMGLGEYLKLPPHKRPY
jgi:hypothetical protein